MSEIADMTPKRILVTDDDASIRRLVTAILRRVHYQVDIATGGRDALEKIDRTRYDVVLLDLMMPDVSGFDVLAQLQVRDPDRRFVIIMSAAAHAVASTVGLNVFAALRKPFQIADLIATVGACIAASTTWSASALPAAGGVVAA
jgi:DNA-binding response OmpR family regulator